MSLIELDYYACAVAIFVLGSIYLVKRSRGLPYPPGPKGLPLVGNIHDVPSHGEWITYADWSHKYNSDVVHLSVVGTHLVIVNSHEAAVELFEKRSAIYSDRPHMPMLMDLIGMDWTFPIIAYGSRWRTHRRLFHEYFNPNAVKQFEPQGLKATHDMLHRLVESPEEYWDHIRLMAGSMILNFAYGIDAQSIQDPFMVMIQKGWDVMSAATNPGLFLVDTIPALRYMPEWMPGTGFKKTAKAWGKIVEAMVEKPFQHVKDEMAKGINPPSFVSHSLDKLEGRDDKEAEAVIRGVSATSFGAGSDTTVAALYTLIYALVMHPEVVKKAHEELDRVVGRDRLPEFTDKAYLPYITAITHEVLRWKPIAPLGVPHRLMCDDVYNGMFLPAGSYVFGNSWAILQDEKHYPEPTKFNPDRFIKDGKLNQDIRPVVTEVAFGFGRRICPGSHLALNTLFINAASILAAFDVGKAIDENGAVIEPSGEYNKGLVCHPLPFKCAFKPRSQQTLDVIAGVYSMDHS